MPPTGLDLLAMGSVEVVVELAIVLVKVATVVEIVEVELTPMEEVWAADVDEIPGTDLAEPERNLCLTSSVLMLSLPSMHPLPSL